MYFVVVLKVQVFGNNRKSKARKGGGFAGNNVQPIPWRERSWHREFFIIGNSTEERPAGEGQV